MTSYNIYEVISLRKRKTKRFFLVFFAVFLLSFIISLAVEKRATPLLEYYAKAQGTTAATEIINETVASVLNETEQIPVNYEKSSDGTVKTITIDSEKMSALKARLSAEAVKSLSKIDEREISVPYGTLTGISLFFGKGPDIKLRLLPEGKISTEIVTDFYSSGINQTVHRVSFAVEAEFYIILPDATLTLNVSESFPLSETVIVGDIPQVYFQNQGD